METKKIAAIAVVAIVVVAACVIAITALNDDDDGNDRLDVDASVPIYGNANNDAYIDGKDRDMIQSIIDGKESWNRTANPYADANLDGVIDSKDLDLVDKIINKESTKITYRNHFDEDQEISYPLTDRRICVTYWQQAEETAILGVWNQVVVASANVTDLNGLLYDTSKVTTIGTIGSSKISEQGVETIKQEKVDLIIATPSATVKATCDELMKDGIEVIYLWYSGAYCIPTIMTMGILLDQTERAQAYAEFCEETMKDLTQKIDNSGIQKPKVIITSLSATSATKTSSGSIKLLASDADGGYYLINKIADAYEGTDANSWGYSFRSIEWFPQNDTLFDWMIDCETYAGFANVDGKYFSQDSYNERFETNAKLFEATTAYKEGHIIGSTFDAFYGFSGCAMLPVICAQLYPDLFSMDDALEHLQYWFDNFSVAHLDVTEDGGFRYTGTGFKASYL